MLVSSSDKVVRRHWQIGPGVQGAVGTDFRKVNYETFNKYTFVSETSYR